MAADYNLPEIKLDASQLYREESLTDRRAGTLRRLVPITAEGEDDASREVVYEGHASLMTPAGSLPLSFEIEAASLEEALQKYPDAARSALQSTLEELEKLRRDQQSSIMVPGQGGGGMGGMPGAGGMPGGGKIQL